MAMTQNMIIHKYKHKMNKVTLLMHYWDNLLKDLEFLSKNMRKDKSTHLLLERIRAIPRMIQIAVLEYFIYKCTQVFHIAFYQDRLNNPNSHRDLLHDLIC